MEKNSYIVSENFLYVKSLSDMEKKEESEIPHSIQFQEEVNSYTEAVEAVEAIKNTRDNTLFIVKGSLTAGELQGLYATTANTGKYIGLDLSNINMAKYPDVGYNPDKLYSSA